MSLDSQDRIYIEQRVSNDAPSPLVAYLLWFFLGIVSAHRFYIGKWGTALLQIASYFIAIGIVWWFIDAFLIPGMIRNRQNGIRSTLARELAA